MTEKINRMYNNSVQNVKKFICKDNFTKTKAFLVCVLACILSVVCEYTILEFHIQSIFLK